MEPIYVVLIINLVIWAGIFSYVFITDKKVNELQKKLSKLTGEND